MNRKRPSLKRPNLEGATDIRRAAMDLLARREHSRLELVNKLLDRVENPTVLDTVLDQLIEDNLLSDQRFCEAYVYSRTNKGFGPVRIKAELRDRGVKPSLIENSLINDNTAWIENLNKVIIKKYGDISVNSLKELARQQRFLLHRGFTFEQIRQAIRLQSE